MSEAAIKVEVLSWLARGMNFPREDKAVWEEPVGAGETLGDLMDRLAARYAHFGEFYDPVDRVLKDHVELVVNGRLYDLAGGFSVPLQPGDSVMLFPGFSGG